MYDIMFATRARTLVTIVLLSLAAVLVVAGWVAVTSGAAGSAPSTAATTPAATTSTPEPEPIDGTVYVEDHIRLNDGRDVTCVRYKDKLLSCDWNGAGATADAQR